MSLQPYKITALRRNDSGGENIIPNAIVAITANGGYASLYESDGTTPISNPFTCDSNGEREVWIESGLYNISVSGGQSWDVIIGSAVDHKDTYADVRALTASYPFETIIVGGHSAVGDGSGGEFVKVASGSDDGGIILVTSAGDVFKRVYSGAVKSSWFEVIDFQYLLELPDYNVDIDQVITITAPVSATLTAAKNIFGGGSVVYSSGSVYAGVMITIDVAGFDLDFNIGVVGQNLIHSGVRVNSSTVMSSDLPTVRFGAGTVLGGFYQDVPSAAGNYCLGVVGSFESVVFDGCKSGTVGRASGAGVIGVSGTNGIFVSQASASLYPKKVQHFNVTYDGMYSNEVGAADADCDYFAAFVPDPTNFPNDTATFNEFPPVHVESRGCTYHNPIGRCEKYQCVPDSHDHKVLYNGGRTIAVGGGILFNAQWGVGSFRDIYIQLNADSGVSPLVNGLGAVSFFVGVDYGTVRPGLSCKNITIENNIPASLNNTLSYLVGINSGAGAVTQNIGNAVLSGLSLSSGSVDHVLKINQSTAYGTIALQDINVAACNYAIIGASDSAINIDISAVNIRNGGTSVELYGNDGGGQRQHSGMLNGHTLYGISNTTFRSGPVSGKAAMLYGAALAGSGDTLAGAGSVQGETIDNDGTVAFKVRGYTNGQHLFMLSTSFGVGGLFYSTGASGTITMLTVPFAASFSLGVGSNPDTAGKVNIWVDASGLVNIKNRLGSDRGFTLFYLG